MISHFDIMQEIGKTNFQRAVVPDDAINANASQN